MALCGFVVCRAAMAICGVVFGHAVIVVPMEINFMDMEDKH
jgi:hypothetical protein